jgi:hypothetical protein
MAATVVDHYKVLGLEVSATAAEIRTSYRELSKRHHPDRGGDPESFARVTTSYGVLSDPQARDMYDVERRLAASRAADAVRSAHGEPSGAQQWAATVFGPETPARPQRPGAQATKPSPATSSPTFTDQAEAAQAEQAAYQAAHGEPMRATAEKLHYAAHRAVSYAIAAVVGGLWWPVQYALAKLSPSSTGHPAYDLQKFVERPGAALLVPVLAALAVFCERRLFPVHTVRTTPSRVRRLSIGAVVVVVLWFNVYLAQVPYALGALGAVALVAASSMIKRQQR